MSSEIKYPFCFVYNSHKKFVHFHGRSQISLYLHSEQGIYILKFEIWYNEETNQPTPRIIKTYPEFVDYRYPQMHELTIAYSVYWKEFETEEDFLKEYSWTLFV